MDKTRKKRIRRYLAWGCLAAVVVLLAVMPMLASSAAAEDGPQVSILTTQAVRTDIAEKLIGGGLLASKSDMDLTIPVQVKLKEYLVNNGDVVKKGDAIAVVDRVSVMTAITQVQETLDYLATQIENASDEEVSHYINSQVNGTVKHIYAREGEDVQNVMLEHGALAVVSLDDLMAVKLEQKTDLESGDRVSVTLSDGTEVEGEVASNLDGVLVVTVEDDNYPSGETVAVYTEDGGVIGSGELYIFSPWTAHGYSGTVFSVQVKEGQKVYSGQSLLRLTETGITSDYQKLVNQRREYEDMMQDLFRMYASQTLDAPCDGIVTGVDSEGSFLLSDSGQSWTVGRLTHNPAAQSGFLGYLARVEALRPDGLELMADPTVRSAEDLGEIRVDPAAMRSSWSYTGDTRVYELGENGLLNAAGNACEGDILFFAGDETQIHWIIRLNEAPSSRNTASDTGFRAVLLDSAEGDGESGNEGDNEGGGEGSDPPAGGGSGNEGGGDTGDEGGGDTGNECTGQEGCGAATHNPGCPLYQPPTYYWGYVAQIKEVGQDGKVKVMQTAGTYAIADPKNPPAPSAEGLTVEKTYVGLTGNVGDLVWIIIDGTGAFYNPAIALVPGAGAQMPGDLSGLLGGLGGMMGGFGGMGGYGGSTAPVFEPYSLDTLTVATVTSQETMSIDVVIDEEDVLLLSVGQKAELIVGAMGGQRFEAVITKIANSGVNAGGRTKYTVTATTSKHEDMYPGMTGVLVIPIDEVENILAIPVAALVEAGAKTVVYTGYDAEKETLLNPIEVATGVSDGEMVEITGLEEGATVYYEYYDTLELSLTPEERRLF